MDVSWWCAARSEPWSWTPVLYPGIWLCVLALAVGYALGLRRAAARGRAATRSQIASFAAGWLALWLLLDWPVGALAAGYLLSAHMLQYVAISMLLAPALLGGLPSALRDEILAAAPARPLRWLVERPVAAFAVFNLAMVVTHLPVVADTLKPLQFGNMAIDLVWLAAALAFWWALEPAPGAGEAFYGRRMLLLLGTKILPIAVGALYALSDFPHYRTYELAPRVIDLSAKGDQTIAGWLMWMGATPILVGHLAASFFAWHALEARRAGET